LVASVRFQGEGGLPTMARPIGWYVPGVKRLRPVAIRIAAALLGLVLAGAVAELGLRLAGVLPAQRNPLSGFHVADDELGWRGAPGLEARFVRSEFDVVVRHGDDGFRAPEAEPGDGDLLAVLGDSFVWGWGVGQGEVLTDRLARLTGRPVRNLGLNAAGTGQQVLILERFAGDATDALLLFFHNDLRDDRDARGGERPLFRLVDGELVLSPARPRGRGALFRRSRLLSLARLQVDRVLAAGRGGPPGVPSCEDWSLERALLERAAAAPPRLRLAYVPTAPELVTGSSCRDGLVALGAELELPVLDLTGPLADGCPEGDSADAPPCYFPQDGHWTARGHLLAAQALAARL